MQIVKASAVAALLFVASPAQALDSINMNELTCATFTGYDDENKATIMMWLEGYYTEEDEPAVIDFNEMAGHMAKLLLYCQENPEKSVLDGSEDAMD